jgi:hypothetical protein
MSSTVEAAIDIRPFHVDTPDEALEDLRRRIAATNWPEKATVFPGEQHQAPRSWAEPRQPQPHLLQRSRQGGYFAAWEQPQLCAEEIRAAFRSLR